MAIDEEKSSNEITEEVFPEDTVQIDVPKGKKGFECFCTDKADADDDYVRVPLSTRLRNWPVWLALLGSVGIILNSAGVFARWGLDTDAWNTIVNAIGGIFIALGVVNNPTDLKHF